MLTVVSDWEFGVQGAEMCWRRAAALSVMGDGY